MTLRSPLFVLGLCLGVAASLYAGPNEPVAPAPPQTYDVQLRYKIDAFRNQRIVQFREMLNTLQGYGFVKGPGPDDEESNRTVTRMGGTVGSPTARQLLRERHVQAIRLLPQGTAPGKPEDRVRVLLELASPLPVLPGRYLYSLEEIRRLEGTDAVSSQRLLADQTRSVLTKMSFEEAVGYDTRAHTRLVGSIPWGQLDTLLEDLRTRPGVPELPAPFATRSPILVVEVMPQLPVPMSLPAEPAIPEGQEKITPELRGLLTGKDADTPRRLEVILWVTPKDDRGWRQDLEKSAPGLQVEGRLGPIVTVLAAASQAPVLASLPIVSTVRAPRSAQHRPFLASGTGTGTAVLGRDPGLQGLTGVSRGGRGVLVALIDGDFRGWQERLGKGLPVGTRLLDLTAERNSDLNPDPIAAGGLGHGTHLALAAAEVAPEAQFLLIRIDPEAPYQLLTIARSLAGMPSGSINLDRRGRELEAQRDALAGRLPDLLAERRAAFEGREDEEVLEKLRIAYRKNQASYEAEDREHQARMRRYLKLYEDLRGLAKVRTAASGLVWHEGHAVDGGGPLALFFDEQRGRRGAWFQTLGAAPGQALAGPFLDQDGDGLAAFRPAKEPLPEGLWTRDLAFLSWVSAEGKQTPDLPAGARIRLSVQWREPHDSEFLAHGEDVYRTPLATGNLVVLRQSDPTGKTRPQDDFDVVARSGGLPQRIENHPKMGVYEQTVEFQVKEPGRYALQFRGRQPAGIRPAGAPTLPSQRQSWELRTRIFAQTFEGAGRGVFRDFATEEGSVGTPADATTFRMYRQNAGDPQRGATRP